MTVFGTLSCKVQRHRVTRVDILPFFCCVDTAGWTRSLHRYIPFMGLCRTNMSSSCSLCSGGGKYGKKGRGCEGGQNIVTLRNLLNFREEATYSVFVHCFGSLFKCTWCLSAEKHEQLFYKFYLELNESEISSNN